MARRNLGRLAAWAKGRARRRARRGDQFFTRGRSKAPFAGSALTGFVALLRLVDDVNAALAAHQAVVAVARTKRFQRVANFHGVTPTECCGQNPRRVRSARSYARFGGADQAAIVSRSGTARDRRRALRPPGRRRPPPPAPDTPTAAPTGAAPDAAAPSASSDQPAAPPAQPAAASPNPQ